MKMRVILPLALSIIAGLCAYTVIDSIRRATPAPVKQETQLVVVANRDLPATVKLVSEMLDEVEWPPELVPNGAYSDATELVGRVLRSEVSGKSAIVDAFLAPRGTSAGLQGKIPPGYRARAIRIDEVTSVGGHLIPGAHVDVVAATRDRKSNRFKPRTILKNVEVLAVGQSLNAVADDETGNPRTNAQVRSVTLLLTPDEVKVIAAHEANNDRLTLSLRSGEEEPGDSDVAWVEETPPAPPKPAPIVTKIVAPKPQAKPLQRFRTTVISGDKEVQVIYVNINGRWLVDPGDDLDPEELEALPELPRNINAHVDPVSESEPVDSGDARGAQE